MYRTIVFDFDGTLADTYAVGVATFAKLAPRFGLTLPADPDAARHTPTRELLKQVGLSFWSLPRFVRAFRAEAAAHAGGVKLFPGVPDVLHELAARGCRLGVLSSSSDDTIRTALRANGVEGRFAFVVGGRAVFGKGRPLRRLVRAEKGRAVLYVGDETRDVDAATAAGVDAAAVTWGFQTEALLRTANPRFVLTDPRELVALV